MKRIAILFVVYMNSINIFASEIQEIIIAQNPPPVQQPVQQPTQQPAQQMQQGYPQGAQPKKRRKKKKEKPMDNTTAGQREQKMIGVGAGGGNLFGGIYGAKGELSINISRRLQLGLYGMYGTFNDSSTSIDENIENPQNEKSYRFTANVTLSGGGTDLRLFLGNSFSFGFGLGLRMMTFKIEALDLYSEELLLSTEATNNSTFFAFDVSNQWIFNSGFYIKCVWLGYAYTISSNKSTNLDGSLMDEETAKLFQTHADAFADIGSLNAAYFLFTIGAFF